MKIISSGSGLYSPKFYKKKRKKKRFLLILSLIAAIVVLGFVIYFSRHSFVVISEVRVVGEGINGEKAIQDSVEKIISGYHFFLVPKANALIYPRKVIKETVLGKFPRIKSIDLDLDGLRILNVEVQERVPFALYCANPFPCFYLDEEGFIFASLPDSPDQTYFKYFRETPLINPLGENLLPSEEFKSLTDFIKVLPSLGIDSRALEIGDNEYSLILSGGSKIIWRQGDDFVLLFSNLEAFLSDEAIQSQEDFLEKVLYLDMRVANKVFYKFK